MKTFNFLGLSFLSVFLFTCSPPVDENREYGWFDFVMMDLDTTENQIDLSFLNEDIAGMDGHIRVKDGHFVDGNGDPIRFFGTNLTFSACFPQKDTATLIAARLEKMGMNVVRFHHMDMRPSPSGIWDESMEKFDPEQVEKLDWLIYQLKQHGIYTNINLHVSRTYPGVEYDNINQFNFGKSIDNFYRPYIEMQKDFARELLSHKNPYTGTTYLEESAIAFVEINNENSLLSNWRLLPQLTDEHRSSLQRQWDGWLKEHGHDPMINKLFEIIELYDTETSENQKKMLWGFLMDTEMAYMEEMVDFVKNELQSQSLIANSQASYSGVAGVLREAKYSDFIDMHAYWEHPSFPGQSWSRTNWRIRNSSMVSDDRGGTMGRFGEHKVEDMPLTISEYDHPAPNFFVAEMYPMLNSVAAYQDWDGIYHFNFNDPWDSGKINGFFSSAGHPLKQVFIPVGAIMFRMETIQKGTQSIQLQIPEEAILDKLVSYGHELRLHRSNMEYIWEEAGADRSLTLLHPMNVTIGGDELRLNGSFDVPEGPWMSETEEILWDHQDSTDAYFTINSGSVKTALGYIGGDSFDLGNVTIAVDSTEYNWATITITSMDGKSLEEAESILVVAAGRAENTDMKWNEEKTTVGSNWGKKPVRVEGIPVRISFRDMPSFSAYVLDPQGNMTDEVPVYKRRSERILSLGAQYKTLWYILKRN